MYTSSTDFSDMQILRKMTWSIFEAKRTNICGISLSFWRLCLYSTLNEDSCYLTKNYKNSQPGVADLHSRSFDRLFIAHPWLLVTFIHKYRLWYWHSLNFNKNSWFCHWLLIQDLHKMIWRLHCWLLLINLTLISRFDAFIADLITWGLDLHKEIWCFFLLTSHKTIWRF